jgi:hypothetical protein
VLVRHVVKEPPKMVLRRMMSPSLETGTVFDAVLSVNYCANCDSVSVRAVREKCDEKGGAEFGLRVRRAMTDKNSFPLD